MFTSFQIQTFDGFQPRIIFQSDFQFCSSNFVFSPGEVMVKYSLNELRNLQEDDELDLSACQIEEFPNAIVQVCHNHLTSSLKMKHF